MASPSAFELWWVKLSPLLGTIQALRLESYLPRWGSAIHFQKSSSLTSLHTYPAISLLSLPYILLAVLLYTVSLKILKVLSDEG